MIKQRRLVVYQLPGQWRWVGGDRIDFEWRPIDKQLLQQLFDSQRLRTFEKFLGKYFFGIVWHNTHEWVSYAWMSLPETFGPPHLPRHIQRLPVYWIFYCRTKDEYQGRGLYKASLSLLCRWARERNRGAEVYIDTEPNNIPSRRAIEAVGFLPKGVITTWTFRVPKLSLTTWGRWDPNVPHPYVPNQ